MGKHSESLVPFTVPEGIMELVYVLPLAGAFDGPAVEVADLLALLCGSKSGLGGPRSEAEEGQASQGAQTQFAHASSSSHSQNPSSSAIRKKRMGKHAASRDNNSLERAIFETARKPRHTKSTMQE